VIRRNFTTMASGFYRTLKQGMQVRGFPRNLGNSVIYVQDPGRETRKPNSGPLRNMSDPLWDRNNKSPKRYSKAKERSLKRREAGSRSTQQAVPLKQKNRPDGTLLREWASIAILCSFLNKGVLVGVCSNAANPHYKDLDTIMAYVPICEGCGGWKVPCLRDKTA